MSVYWRQVGVQYYCSTPEQSLRWTTATSSCLRSLFHYRRTNTPFICPSVKKVFRRNIGAAACPTQSLLLSSTSTLSCPVLYARENTDPVSRMALPCRGVPPPPLWHDAASPDFRPVRARPRHARTSLAWLSALKSVAPYTFSMPPTT